MNFLPAFEGGGTIACDGGWFSMSQTSFAVGKGFTFGENVALQQRTFRHEKSRFFAPPSFEGRQRKG